MNLSVRAEFVRAMEILLMALGKWIVTMKII